MPPEMPAKPLVVLFAHPDDEFAVFPVLRSALREGRPLSCVWLTDGGWGGQNMEQRRRESIAVLAGLGLPEAAMRFLGQEWQVPDGALHQHLDRVIPALVEALAESCRDGEVLVPAWEGGHQDHDACHLAGIALARSARARLRQFPLYHGAGLPGPWFRVLDPLPANGPVDVQPTRPGERLGDALRCLGYASQWRSFIGLLPFYLWRMRRTDAFGLQDVAMARTAGPAHEGRVLYERRGGPTWSGFAEATSRWRWPDAMARDMAGGNAPKEPLPAQEAAGSLEGMPVSFADAGYQNRIAQENATFADQVDVHALPEIFHYWSNRYLLPMEQVFGFQHPEDFLAKHLLDSSRRTGAARPHFVSLGSGNCDAEVRIAQDLRRRGLHDFVLECIDINPAMLERGLQLAREAGLENVVVPVAGDFNRWTPTRRYDGIMANQSLHHVLGLEDLFDAIRGALAPGALFVVSDMIGRNGHQRWPEALDIVRESWKELPDAYRYNRQLQRPEPEFLDWDCSVEGFEGIRSQDILPLLVERFGFEFFLAFGNVIDPFIDRGFGHNFDPLRDWDRDFIDRVHARDEAELMAGRIKPTHMMAVMTADTNAVCTCRAHLTPRFCIRKP